MSLYSLLKKCVLKQDKRKERNEELPLILPGIAAVVTFFLWCLFLCLYKPCCPCSTLGHRWRALKTLWFPWWVASAEQVGGGGSFLTFFPVKGSVSLAAVLGPCCDCLVAKSCPTLLDPVDCSPPGFSVHGILQARVLEWVTISFSRESSWTSYRACVSSIRRRSLYCWALGSSLDPHSSPHSLCWSHRVIPSSILASPGWPCF